MIFDFIDGKIIAIDKDNAINLMNAARDLYNSALGTFFEKLRILDEELEGKLANKGISEGSLTEAAELVKGDGFHSDTIDYIKNKDNEEIRKEYKIKLRTKFGEIFEDTGAPLNDFTTA